jgi:hypothetical protein
MFRLIAVETLPTPAGTPLLYPNDVSPHGCLVFAPVVVCFRGRLGFRVLGLGFRILGFRVYVLGFRF